MDVVLAPLTIVLCVKMVWDRPHISKSHFSPRHHGLGGKYSRIYLDEEGHGFESRRCQYKIVIFCRDRHEEKLETPDFKETRQEAI